MSASDTDQDEKKECPYCGKICSSQGIYTHVLRSVGGGHGPHIEVPEDFDVSSLKPINKNQKFNVSKSKSKKATNHLYLCNWCNQLCKGERGYKIHISKSKGDILHPEGASIEDQEYTLIPCDDDWNPFMDLEQIYKLQERRRNRGKIVTDNINRPVHNVSDDVAEQIATLFSIYPQMQEEPNRVKNIFSCSDEDFREGVEMYNEQKEFETYSF